MNDRFISIIQKVISDRGKGVVKNITIFNSLLADYAKGEFVRERKLFIRELKTKPFDEVLKQYLPPPQASSRPPRNVAGSVSARSDYDADVDYDEEDLDDDEDNLSSRPARRQQGLESFSVKCPRCGETGEISDKRDISSRHLGYVCPGCGEAFKIEFFGTCRSCRQNVGFNVHRLGTVILAAGTAILDVLSDKPKGIISTISDVVKEAYPYASAAGECTFCKQTHVECPKCRSAVKFPHNKRIDKDVVRCHNCGKMMRHP